MPYQVRLRRIRKTRRLVKSLRIVGEVIIRQIENDFCIQQGHCRLDAMKSLFE